jgi:uncharacterized damage-inducible protein DinB
MTVAEAFAAELTREAAVTRRVLERVPDEHLAWRPHVRSMSLGQLAYHIAALPQGIVSLLTPASADVPTGSIPENTPVAEILATFDQSVTIATEKLIAWGDDGLRETWRMTRGGETLLEAPRIGVVRSLMFNHWYHHRGQLTVYLRLLDVPLPSIYGPTADENPFG